VPLAALAIVLLAWSIPARAVDGEDRVDPVRAELDTWTQAFNARQADGSWKIIRYLAYTGPE